MLAQVLKRLQSGENLSPTEIAAELGITEELVYMMSEELARQGYLEEVDPCDPCHSTCSDCPEKSGCGAGKAGRMWLLTQKGQKST